jgi:hypothetical protein
MEGGSRFRLQGLTPMLAAAFGTTRHAEAACISSYGPRSRISHDNAALGNDAGEMLSGFAPHWL